MHLMCPTTNAIVHLVLLSFAIVRLSIMITHEAGPFNVFGRLRQRFERRDEFGKKLPCIPGGMCDLMTCFACNSVWVSLSACISYTAYPRETMLVTSPLWLAGLVMGVHNLVFR